MTHTVTALADQASAAVHELACLTRPAITALDVHDLRTVTGALAELAAGLPQTLRQLSGYLTADALTAPSGPYTGDPDTAVAHAHTCLRQAAAAAAHLATALDAAHQTLGELAETTQTGPEGVNIQPTTRGQISTGVDNSDLEDARRRAALVRSCQGQDVSVRVVHSCRTEDVPFGSSRCFTATVPAGVTPSCTEG
jgi:hypothetical protein